MPRGEDGQVGELALGLAADRVKAGDALDFIAKKFDAYRVLGVGGAELDGVAADAELAAGYAANAELDRTIAAEFASVDYETFRCLENACEAPF